MNNYDIDIKNNCVTLKINGTIHLMLRQDELIGVQSWIEGDNDDKYCIEYYTKSNTILCEYDDISKWKDILNMLDKITLFNKQWK